MITIGQLRLIPRTAEGCWLIYHDDIYLKLYGGGIELYGNESFMKIIGVDLI